MKTVLAALLLAIGFAGPASAADAPDAAIGTVKRVVGEATLQRGGQQQPLLVGQKLAVGDLIRTGTGAGASVTLADDTLLSTGPNSELALTEFSFDPTSHDGGMLLSLWRGVVSVVTGLVAQKTPDKVKVQTRTVVLGVRGTEFVLETGERLP